LPSEEEEENVQDDIENHDSGHDGNNYDDANSDSDEHQNDDYCFNNNFVFKRQNGGLVYLAINDILNHYDTKKKAAHAVKTAKHGREDDKKNTPEKYGKEFVEHVQNL
jgi:ABC-type Zn2+ transport system substrate-binding protein/surface adhesin